MNYAALAHQLTVGAANGLTPREAAWAEVIAATRRCNAAYEQAVDEGRNPCTDPLVIALDRKLRDAGLAWEAIAGPMK